MTRGAERGARYQRDTGLDDQVFGQLQVVVPTPSIASISPDLGREDVEGAVGRQAVDTGDGGSVASTT
jgi:hypothetical protein